MPIAMCHNGDTVFLTKLTVSHAASQSAGASVKTLVPFPKGPQGQVYLPAKYAVTGLPISPRSCPLSTSPIRGSPLS